MIEGIFAKARHEPILSTDFVMSRVFVPTGRPMSDWLGDSEALIVIQLYMLLRLKLVPYAHTHAKTCADTRILLRTLNMHGAKVRYIDSTDRWQI